jgi:hypothetical protein
LFSQNEQLAQYYYDKGDFEKAKSAMKNCWKKSLRTHSIF